MDIHDHYVKETLPAAYGSPRDIWHCRYCGQTVWGDRGLADHIELFHQNALDHLDPEYAPGDIVYYMVGDNDGYMRGTVQSFRRDEVSVQYLFTIKWDDEEMAVRRDIGKEIPEAYLHVTDPTSGKAVVDVINSAVEALEGLLWRDGTRVAYRYSNGPDISLRVTLPSKPRNTGKEMKTKGLRDDNEVEV